VDVKRASAPSIRFAPGLLGRVLRSCRQLAVGA